MALKAHNFKHFGLSQILASLIKDLKILETEGIKIKGVLNKVKGSIVFIVDDNLGSHEIGGYSTNFNSTPISCRFCLSVVDMWNIFKDDLFARRNRDTHARHVSMLQINPIYNSIYGIKFDSPFKELSNFHISNMLPFDPMHDLLEGIVPMALKLIIDSFHFVISTYSKGRAKGKTAKSQYGAPILNFFL